MCISIPSAYSEPCQTSKMERFAKIVKSFSPLGIFAKHSIWDVWHGPGYVAEYYHNWKV